MAQADSEVDALSSRLQTNLLALNGKQAAPARFHWKLLIPVAVVAGAVLLFSLSPRVRNNSLVRRTLLAALQILQWKIAADLL